MNEIDWLTSSDPAALLAHLEGKASARKLRLFACACARRYFQLLRYPAAREAVVTAQRHADGLASDAQLEEVRQRAELWAADAPMFEAFAYLAAAACTAEAAAEAARTARENGRLMAVRESAYEVVPGQDEARINAEASAAECRAQADLLREIFGNPFRATTLPRVWLDWGNGAVAGMARLLYDQDQLAELPYLADALCDAGCTDEALLRHLRQPAGHVRGCWAVDLLLAKE